MMDIPAIPTAIEETFRRLGDDVSRCVKASLKNENHVEQTRLNQALLMLDPLRTIFGQMPRQCSTYHVVAEPSYTEFWTITDGLGYGCAVIDGRGTCTMADMASRALIRIESAIHYISQSKFLDAAHKEVYTRELLSFSTKHRINGVSSEVP